MIRADGSTEYWVDGQSCLSFRDNMIDRWTRRSTEMDQEWHKDGKINRTNGPDPAIVRVGFVKVHLKNGVLHQDSDVPSVETPFGNEEYYQNGHCHRVGGPAMIYRDGTQIYCINGVITKVVQENPLPEPYFNYIDENTYWLTYPTGHVEHYCNNVIHRDNDLPAVMWGGDPITNCAGGTKIRCKDGKYHRDGDKAAVMTIDGTSQWLINGVFNRGEDMRYKHVQCNMHSGYLRYSSSFEQWYLRYDTHWGYPLA